MEDKIEAIRARHEADPYDRSQAVADRATLLAHIDQLVAELAKIANRVVMVDARLQEVQEAIRHNYALAAALKGT
jgi:hypothetical protein